MKAFKTCRNFGAEGGGGGSYENILNLKREIQGFLMKEEQL